MGKIMKSLSLIVAISLSMLLVFSACNKKPGAEGPVTLRCAFWGDVKEIQIIKNSVERFKEANPGIEVALERLPAGDPYTEKILTQLAGGNPVDVMFVNAEQFYIYAKKGILMPLNKYVERDNFPVDKFYPKIIDKFSLDGELYTLPRDIAPVCVIYYNKDIFKNAGVSYPKDNWTWDDLLKKAKQLTKEQKGGKTIFGFAEDWPMWEPFVFSWEGKLVDDVKKPTKCMLGSKEAIDALTFKQDLIYKHKVMPSPSQLTAMGGVGSSELFMQGHAAMFYSGIWKSPFFREIKKFEWDAVWSPKGPTGKRGYMVSGGGYAVLKKSKHPDEAWKLITYLAGEDGQKELAQTGLAQPAIKSIAASKDFLDGKPPKSKKFLLEAVNYGYFGPNTEKYAEMNSAYVYPNLDRVWSGEKKPSEVMPIIEEEINKNLFK